MGADRLNFSAKNKRLKLGGLSVGSYNVLTNLLFNERRHGAGPLFELGNDIENSKGIEGIQDAICKHIEKEKTLMHLKRIKGMGKKRLDEVIDWLGDERIDKLNEVI